MFNKLETFSEYLTLQESRLTSIQYKETKTKGVVSKVIATLTGSQSGIFTKLLNRFSRIDKLEKKLKVMREELNDKIRDKSNMLFDAEDEVITRVVQTAQYSITIAKKAEKEPTSKTDWEAVAGELIKLIDKELQPQINAIIDKYTELKEASDKQAAVRVKKLDEGMMEFFKDIFKSFSAFLEGIREWGSSFDSKLKAIKKMEVKE